MALALSSAVSAPALPAWIAVPDAGPLWCWVPGLTLACARCGTTAGLVWGRWRRPRPAAPPVLETAACAQCLPPDAFSGPRLSVFDTLHAGVPLRRVGR